jgi:hypothetical protein
VLGALQIIPRILGVHVIDDAIPLYLGIFLQGLAKEVIDQPHLDGFKGFGLLELCFHPLPLTQPVGCLGLCLIVRSSRELPDAGCNS